MDGRAVQEALGGVLLVVLVAAIVIALMRQQ